MVQYVKVKHAMNFEGILVTAFRAWVDFRKLNKTFSSKMVFILSKVAGL